MSGQLRVCGFLVVALVGGLGVTDAACSELVPREALDALWEQHMLEGRSVTMAVESHEPVCQNIRKPSHSNTQVESQKLPSGRIAE
jgi:hypothetical protein